MNFEAGKLTALEKAELLQGTDFMYTRGVPRLNIPRISMADGSSGLRKQIGGRGNVVARSEPATAFPSAACVASSWNTENAEKIGRAIGEECRFYGIHMLLGPGVNIKRNPLCGRNFEYYSEDPLLSGKFGAAFVRGVQSSGVGACLKHFALNNQENFRFVGNSVVDERAMREIYLKPFEITVKEGKPCAVMSAYNRINGIFASENKWLLTDVLRKEWGFDGIVMSDWGGTHDRIGGIRAGEDLEMPGDTSVNLKSVFESLEDGSLSEADVDMCVSRIVDVTAKYAVPPVKKFFDAQGHSALAEAVAIDSAVLMKNDGILPLDKNASFCVIGELFVNMRYQGSGSSMIFPTEVITYRDAFEAREIKYEYSRGYSTGSDRICGDLVDDAVRLAEKYDTVLLYLGLTDLTEGEGGDREHMRLPDDQIRLADALIGIGKNIVVILSGGSPVELPFADSVSAILNMYLPGQRGGEAGTELMFGEANPSGKLAETWYKSYSDVPYGEDYSKKYNELYKESVFVGYRYAKTANIRPAFVFGSGLSYTSFRYGDLIIKRESGTVKASFTICNTGNYSGAEVVQLYVKSNADPAVFKPESELRAFKKVYLKPGEEQSITLSFDTSQLAFWDSGRERAILEDGEYTIEIGASSDDIRLKEKFEITEGAEVTGSFMTPVLREKMKNARHIDDSTFSELLGVPLPDEPPMLPLTPESRLCDFCRTSMGKLLYNAVSGVTKSKMRKAKKLPLGAERDNHIKSATFLKRMFDTNCIRSLSFSAGRSMPLNVAEGLVLFGNGHVFRGICTMFRSYKVRTTKMQRNAGQRS